MPSKASRAADRMDQDRVKREGPNLTVVPDPETPGAPDADEPAAPLDPIAQQAADLFAAFTAGQAQGATAPPATAAAAAGQAEQDKAAETTPEPVPAPKPVPKPAAEQPKPKEPKPPKPARAPKPAPTVRVANPDADQYSRHIGTVTLDGKVHDCEHAARNGHMDEDTAWACANRLLRNYAGGTTGTRLHPVRRDRNGAKVS